MTDQKRPGRYPAEMRERAVRMVFEAEQHSGSRWEAICSVAEKLGPTSETVRKWVQRVEIDEGRKPGLTTDERERLKTLERENRELRRANEMTESTSRRNAACEMSKPRSQEQARCREPMDTCRPSRRTLRSGYVTRAGD